MRKTYETLAPIRICDLGGWTDTWFAGRGSVLNVAVSPYVRCLVTVDEVPESDERFVLSVEDYGDRYRIDPRNVVFGKHPLLEACVKSMGVPRGLDVEVSLHSSVPGGSSTGTSAAVTVALLAALGRLSCKSRRLSPYELSVKAHEVETIHLRRQSGVQDQICSAFGGVCFIDMDDYPHSNVTRVPVARGVLKELERRLTLVFLGRSHDSTSVHEEVIRSLLDDRGADRLEPLRRAAVRGRDALISGDLETFGASMTGNSEGQMNLNAALVSRDALKIFDIARKHGALGWKVNGAGGDGGSVTILGDGDPSHRADMIGEIEALGGGIREIGIRLDGTGVRTMEPPTQSA